MELVGSTTGPTPDLEYGGELLSLNIVKANGINTTMINHSIDDNLLLGHHVYTVSHSTIAHSCAMIETDKHIVQFFGGLDRTSSDVFTPTSHMGHLVRRAYRQYRLENPNAPIDVGFYSNGNNVHVLDSISAALTVEGFNDFNVVMDAIRPDLDQNSTDNHGMVVLFLDDMDYSASISESFIAGFINRNIGRYVLIMAPGGNTYANVIEATQTNSDSLYLANRILSTYGYYASGNYSVTATTRATSNTFSGSHQSWLLNTIQQSMAIPASTSTPYVYRISSITTPINNISTTTLQYNTGIIPVDGSTIRVQITNSNARPIILTRQLNVCDFSDLSINYNSSSGTTFNANRRTPNISMNTHSSLIFEFAVKVRNTVNYEVRCDGIIIGRGVLDGTVATQSTVRYLELFNHRRGAMKWYPPSATYTIYLTDGEHEVTFTRPMTRTLPELINVKPSKAVAAILNSFDSSRYNIKVSGKIRTIIGNRMGLQKSITNNMRNLIEYAKGGVPHTYTTYIATNDDELAEVIASYGLGNVSGNVGLYALTNILIDLPRSTIYTYTNGAWANQGMHNLNELFYSGTLLRAVNKPGFSITI